MLNQFTEKFLRGPVDIGRQEGQARVKHDPEQESERPGGIKVIEAGSFGPSWRFGLGIHGDPLKLSPPFPLWLKYY